MKSAIRSINLTAIYLLLRQRDHLHCPHNKNTNNDNRHREEKTGFIRHHHHRTEWTYVVFHARFLPAACEMIKLRFEKYFTHSQRETLTCVTTISFRCSKDVRYHSVMCWCGMGSMPCFTPWPILFGLWMKVVFQQQRATHQDIKMKENHWILMRRVHDQASK